MISLDGKRAIVTGAGKGIGRETAIELVKAGATVAVASRTQADLESLAGMFPGKVHPFKADVSQRLVVTDLFEAATATLGGLDILVAAAGVATFGNSVELPDEVWERTLAINLTGMFYCNMEAIRKMLPAGEGDIVNVLSMVAVHAMPGSAAYTASKSGGLGLTRSLNSEYRSKGIRVMAVLPGATATPFWESQNSPLDITRMIPADVVAKNIVWALGQPRTASVDELLLMPKDGVL